MKFIQLGAKLRIFFINSTSFKPCTPFNLDINRLHLSLRDNSCRLEIVSLSSLLVPSSPSMASAPVPQPQDGPQTYATWLDLPPELRFEILNLVSQGDGNDRLDFYGGERPDRLASYATVCSEWQSFFEKMTFRHLLVHDTAVQEFARIMSGKNARRTTYVRHLLFLIVLPGYSCPSCHKLESWFDIYRYDPSSDILTLTMPC